VLLSLESAPRRSTSAILAAAGHPSTGSLGVYARVSGLRESEEEYPGGMSFTVSFTGQGRDEGIVVESFAQALARVRELKAKQFPAAIWEIPDGQDHGNGRLVGRYRAPPAR
jgi:hypothetical protein